VFATPRAPAHPRPSDANDLIGQGAIFPEFSDDVLAALNGLEPKSLEENQPIDLMDHLIISVDVVEFVKARSVIEESLSSATVTVDEIVRNCQFSPSVL
jgi:DNA processing protein